jgi:hypothetical protein
VAASIGSFLADVCMLHCSEVRITMHGANSKITEELFDIRVVAFCET